MLGAMPFLEPTLPLHNNFLRYTFVLCFFQYVVELHKFKKGNKSVSMFTCKEIEVQNQSDLLL